jgi:hypothetical protein
MKRRVLSRRPVIFGPSLLVLFLPANMKMPLVLLKIKICAYLLVTKIKPREFISITHCKEESTD